MSDHVVLDIRARQHLKFRPASCTIRAPMAAARTTNPFLRLKRRRERERSCRVTYKDLAEELGISEDLAKKLGCESVTSVSPRLAKQFEVRSGGAIRFMDVMRWVEAHMDPAA